MRSESFISKSAEKTKKIAEKLAREILKISFNQTEKPIAAIIVGLEGDLGGGKTTFVQGFARGLGVKKNITSPTFVILKRFRIKEARFKNLIHIDAYRVKNSGEILDLGWEGLANNPQNIILAEWADKIKDILPKNHIQVRFKVVREDEREIIIISSFK